MRQNLLEETLEEKFRHLNVVHSDRRSIRTYLSLLEGKDRETYNHSIRVGITCSKVASNSNLGPELERGLLFSGTLHDIGKYYVPETVLRKTSNFTDADMLEIRKHVLNSYEMIKLHHPFSAEVIVRHHKFQKHGYPEVIPQPSVDFSPVTLYLINVCARVLAIVDHYDALVYRQNERNRKKLVNRNLQDLLIEDFPDSSSLIQNLFNERILVPDGNFSQK